MYVNKALVKTMGEKNTMPLLFSIAEIVSMKGYSSIVWIKRGTI